MITLQLARDHLKIDPGDDDAALTLYLSAAVQAAEKYTGRHLGQGVACDVYEKPEGFSFKLKSRPSGPVMAKVYRGGQVQNYPVTVASNGKAYLPVFVDPCIVSRVELCYRVGDTCVDGKEVLASGDPMIELGILKFLAHAWTHRGDGPNEWARDSGAAELWQTFRPLAWR